MSMMSRLLMSILGGEIVTLLTGLVSNTPPMLVGATHYGYPLPWLFRLVIAPQYNPWRIDLLNFFADIVIWFVIVAIVVFVVERVRKPATR
ncbi:hypothetical protein [[Eubacterium] cellulosolvens]